MSESTASSLQFPAEWILAPEHVLLGAEFTTCEDEALGVSSYLDEKPVEETLASVGLADLTGTCYLVVEGSDAPRFIASCFDGLALAQGEARFVPCVGGAEALISVALVARTGPAGHLIVDISERAEALECWLAHVASCQTEQGEDHFTDLHIQDASSMLVPLLLIGANVHTIVNDYLHEGSDLPPAGHLGPLKLDAIDVLALHLPEIASSVEGVLLCVPPARARVLWRSFLSFSEVMPLGHRTLHHLVTSYPAWGHALTGAVPSQASSLKNLF